MVICLEPGADLLMAHLMPLPLTGSCFSKIQIRFTFLVPAYPGSTGQRAVKRLCVCVSDLPPVLLKLRPKALYKCDDYYYYYNYCQSLDGTGETMRLMLTVCFLEKSSLRMTPQYFSDSVSGSFFLALLLPVPPGCVS